ncbi:endonuclease/exonuclease/phosphatase family protein [Maricaulis sp. D1M11]|uniref:endonuclease/exonuclease/phosphatase family protein n=1 Tax=Maricaulis sp. D1M11 TaxID=3076117 RepID=UPI0039B5F122
MKTRLIYLAVLLITGCGVASSFNDAEAQDRSDSIQVAAWNMEHLAADAGAGCEPRDEAGYRLVADIVDQVDADVWLVQEVENEQALARVFDPESWTFHVEERPSTGNGPVCRGRDDGNRLLMQRTAIVVRDGINHTRGADLAALDVGQRGFLRHGVNVAIEHNGLTLQLMSVHMKSGCFSGDQSDDCPTLFEQVPILEAWADEQSRAGHAVLIGGDFNRRLEQAGDRVWNDINDGDPVNWTVAGEGIGPQCDPRYRAFIDFLVMNEAAAALAVEGTFTETTFEEGRRASDHCPISVTLQ